MHYLRLQKANRIARRLWKAYYDWDVPPQKYPRQMVRFNGGHWGGRGLHQIHDCLGTFRKVRSFHKKYKREWNGDTRQEKRAEISEKEWREEV